MTTFNTFWPLTRMILLFLIVILGVELTLNVLLPNLIHTWRNRRRFRAGKEWRSDRDLLQWLRGMTPAEFEDYIADLFSRLSYKTRAVGQSHDEGIDVIAEKGSITSYIQCKKFITSEVTVGAVRDFYGSLVDHLTNGKGYFITTNKFTLEAEKFAEDKPIELVDGFGLIRYIRLVENRSGKQAQSESKKICPKCDGLLVERIGEYGKFYGCSNYPRCTFTSKLEK